MPVPRIGWHVYVLGFALALASPAAADADVVPLTVTTDFMHARYYSPNLGRFVSVDAVGGVVGSSQSWNRYSYVLNNPVRMVDPTGLYGVDVHFHLTRYLARLAGKSATEAREIARANQDVDVYQSSIRFWNRENFGLHFMGKGQAVDYFNSVAPDKQGAALHSVQDSYSHEGYGWPLGHALQNLIGKSPDDPWRDVGKAMGMAGATFDLLGGRKGELNEDFLEMMFSTRSKAGRIEMIDLEFDRLNGEAAAYTEIQVSKKDVDSVADYYKSQGYTVLVDGQAY